MKKIRNITFFVVVLFLTTGCPMDMDWGLRVVNNSQQTIYVYAAYLQEDLLPISKPRLIEVLRQQEGWISGSYINDEQLKRFSKEQLTMFFLSKDTIDKYNWETVRSKNMVLKLYRFNEQELLGKGNGYQVFYP